MKAQTSGQEKFESEQKDRVLDRDRLRAQDRRARFSAAAEQMSSANAAARIGAVYTLATLADEFGAEEDEASQQTCVDLLCAYARMSLQPGQTTPSLGLSAVPGREEVEMTRAIFSVIRQRCSDEVEEYASWTSRRFDFGGAHIKDADLTGLKLDGGVVNFAGATIWGTLELGKGIWRAGEVNFIGTNFMPGSSLILADTVISGANVRLIRSSFDKSHIRAVRMKVDKGSLRLDLKEVSGSTLSFERSQFLGGSVVLQVRLRKFSHLRLEQVTVAGLLHLRLNLRDGTSARLNHPNLLDSALVRFELTVLQPGARLIIEQPVGPTTSGIKIDVPQYNGGHLEFKKLSTDDGPRIELGGNPAPAPNAILSSSK